MLQTMVMVKKWDGIRKESFKTIGIGDFFRLSCAEMALCMLMKFLFHVSRAFFLLFNKNLMKSSHEK